MNTRELTLISIMSALTVAVAYGRGLALPFLPGLLDFLSIIIFVNGFCFGWFVGGAVGAISMVIYMIIPYPFAHPSAWLFMISPILLTVQGVLGAMFGVVGGFLGRNWEQKKRTDAPKIHCRDGPRRIHTDLRLSNSLERRVLSRVSYLSLDLGSHCLYLHSAVLPLPPIAQAVTNTVIFAVLGYPLIITIKKLPLSLGVAVVDSEEGASTIAG